MNSTRRELLRSAAVFGGALLFSRGLAACGADGRGSGSADSSDDSLVSCAPPTISANHGHELDVPAEDVEAGATKTYSIRGSSSHDHEVTITAEQFAELAGGVAVAVGSTTVAGHSHTVTVTCSGAKKKPAGERDGGSDAGAACGDGARATAVSANHGHALFVPAEDVAAAVAKTYSIEGSASHPHEVTLTEADFAALAAGDALEVVSSNNFGHTHVVTVACA